jgi:hypothetical protein
MFILKTKVKFMVLILAVLLWVVRNVLVEKRQKKAEEAYIRLVDLARKVRENNKDRYLLTKSLLELHEIHGLCFVPVSLLSHFYKGTVLEEILYSLCDRITPTTTDLLLLARMLKWKEIKDDDGQGARMIILRILSDHLNYELLQAIKGHKEFLEQRLKQYRKEKGKPGDSCSEELVLVNEMIRRCKS